MKIAIVGPYPPPYGGISVHIKRMREFLKENGINTLVYNETNLYANQSENIYNANSYRKLMIKILFVKSDIIHFHTIDKRVRSLIFLYKLFRKKIILTIHGESLNNQINQSRILTRWLLLFSIKRIDKIICVNPKNRDELLALGFENKKVEYIASYINPLESKEDEENIPEYVWSFIDSSSFLISANGCIRFYNDEDLYGIDMLIELVSRLRNNKKEVQLIISLVDVRNQNINEKNYYNKLKNKIINLNLQKNILFFESENLEFYPILKRSKLFIRPTNTDGFGISVAESIYYKIPAIASNVCARPNGTIIFQARNIEDLCNRTIEIMDKYNYYKDLLQKIRINDNAADLFKTYLKLLEI